MKPIVVCEVNTASKTPFLIKYLEGNIVDTGKFICCTLYSQLVV